MAKLCFLILILVLVCCYNYAIAEETCHGKSVPCCFCNMKANNVASKGQVYSIGKYLMTGKVLGKGHFATVQEATHRVLSKKVAIKVIDLACIKEEYARRNLHREPKVMARLRHPCIAALYETMMHGTRLYIVMEAAGGGDLCAHVVAARGPSRGLTEARARHLAAQLVSAVRHMHARGVVHRDLKMENIMLDNSKQFIKIVDFGLSNLWMPGGALRTPCGSLEYAAPELFLDGQRYGPEVDLWSIGVIVYGMVTGTLPFSSAAGAFASEGATVAEDRCRPALRAAIRRGITRKQRMALSLVSTDCKTFIQKLLEPNTELRMDIDEASKHKWIKRPGMKMKTYPFSPLDSKATREIYNEISEISGRSVMDVIAEVRAEPFGPTGGMYNIKTHFFNMRSVFDLEILWSNAQDDQILRPTKVEESYGTEQTYTTPSTSKSLQQPDKSAIVQSGSISTSRISTIRNKLINGCVPKQNFLNAQQPFRGLARSPESPYTNLGMRPLSSDPTKTHKPLAPKRTTGEVTKQCQRNEDQNKTHAMNSDTMPNNRISLTKNCPSKKSIFKVFDNGDCLEPRLPRIEEHSNHDSSYSKNYSKYWNTKSYNAKAINMEDENLARLHSCPNKFGDGRRSEIYKKSGDSFSCWRTGGIPTTTGARLMLQTNATTIKRASLGNIASPHSSSNSHCKSERAMPVGWYSKGKEAISLQRIRRTAPMK